MIHVCIQACTCPGRKSRPVATKGRVGLGLLAVAHFLWRVREGDRTVIPNNIPSTRGATGVGSVRETRSRPTYVALLYCLSTHATVLQLDRAHLVLPLCSYFRDLEIASVQIGHSIDTIATRWTRAGRSKTILVAASGRARRTTWSRRSAPWHHCGPFPLQVLTAIDLLLRRRTIQKQTGRWRHLPVDAE